MEAKESDGEIMKLLNEEPEDDSKTITTEDEATPVKEQSENEVDPFEIDESDKRNVERPKVIEFFPQMTPNCGEKTPMQDHSENNDEDDALNIDTDVDFEGEFEWVTLIKKI